MESVDGHQEAHENLESLSLAVCLYTRAFTGSKGALLSSDMHRTHRPHRGLAHRMRGSLQS